MRIELTRVGLLVYLANHYTTRGAPLCTERKVSDTMHWRRASLVLSSQSFVTELALLLSIPQATWSQPHTGRCPTSLPHKKKTVHRMMMRGMSGTTLPCLHYSLPRSFATASPSTCMPFSNCSGSLHSSPKWARCSLMWVAGVTSSLMKISSMYADVAWLMVASWASTMLMMAFIIRGVTFKPNPKCVRQYLLPSIFTVWNGHSDLWTHTWRYAFLMSSRDILEPFCRHSRGLVVQMSALAVNVSMWWLSSRKSMTGRTLDLFCCNTAIKGISPLGGPSFFSGYSTSQPLLYSHLQHHAAS